MSPCWSTHPSKGWWRPAAHETQGSIPEMLVSPPMVRPLGLLQICRRQDGVQG